MYAYYDGVDAVAHAHGLHDGFYEAELRAVDRLVGELRDALPERAALVVTSDHGQVHVGPEGWRALAALGRPDGAGRRRRALPLPLRASAGAARRSSTTATGHYADEAWVFSRDQLLDEGWLGPARPRRRAGVSATSCSPPGAPVAFVDPALPREAGLISAHGSLTPAEIQVPLLAGRGRA